MGQQPFLVYNPHSKGGLADYALAQSRALHEQTGRVIMLCDPELEMRARNAFPTVPIIPRIHLPEGAQRIAPLRAMRFALETLVPLQRVFSWIASQPVAPDALLLPAFSEYFAPLWAPILNRLRRRGIKTAAVIHDPVRDYVRGPRWWHDWSVRAAFSCLDVAFVHEQCKLETKLSAMLPTVVIPHGPYNFKTKCPGAVEARRQLNIPPQVPVFLSFGHIRDGKNLHLFLEALREYPDVHIIVAGKEQSASQRPAAFYQKLAQTMGVAERVRWQVRHIPESETGLFFAAADYLLLTYSRDFRSASGVLAAAAQFRKPVLASSGAGPLKSAVQKYQLGHWIEPDDEHALKQGIHRCLAENLDPLWTAFEEDHSWVRNAEIVIESLKVENRRSS